MKTLIFSTVCEAHDIHDEIEATYKTMPKMITKPFDAIWN